METENQDKKTMGTKGEEETGVDKIDDNENKKDAYYIEYEGSNAAVLTEKRFGSFLGDIKNKEIRNSLRPLLQFYNEARPFTITGDKKEEFLNSDLGKKAIEKYSTDLKSLREVIDKAAETGSVNIKDVAYSELKKGDIIYLNDEIKIFQGAYGQNEEERILTFYDLKNGFELNPEGRSYLEKEVKDIKVKKIEFMDKTEDNENREEETGTETGSKESEPLNKDIKNTFENNREEASRQTEENMEMGEKMGKEIKENKLPDELSAENDVIIKETKETADEFDKKTSEVVNAETAESEEDERFEKFAEEMKAGGKDYVNEAEERQEEWKEKPREEKEAEIEEFSKQNIENDPEIKKVMGNVDELKARLKELAEERDKISDNRMDMMQKLQEYTEGNIDFSELGFEDKLKTKELLSEFRKTAEFALAFEKGDYALEKLEDYEKLLENHEARKINVENLEIMVETIEGLEAYLEQFERMTEIEKAEVRREVEGLVQKSINWVKEHKIEIGLALAIIALGIYIGVNVAGLTQAIPPEQLGAALKYGVAAAGAAAAGLYLIKKREKIIQSTKKVVKAIAGPGGKLAGPVVGMAMVASYLFKGENWDKMMETITGVSVPRRFRTVPEKSK